MKIQLNIDESTCIKCGKCSKVCLVSIFMQPAANAKVELHNIDTCMKCGQCVTMCPTGSVKHSLFPAQVVHPIDHKLLPSSEQLMMLIKSRRSTRNFSKKAIPESALNLIIEAANSAPTAGNSQNISYTLVTDPEKLRRVTELTVKSLVSKTKIMKNCVVRPIVRKFSPTMYRLSSAVGAIQANLEAGGDPILRGATTLLLIHSTKDSTFGAGDANLSYQNGSLMAESLGLGQLYTGFVIGVIKSSGVRELLGIKGDVHAGMALGIPSLKYTNYVDREIKLDKVDK